MINTKRSRLLAFILCAIISSANAVTTLAYTTDSGSYVPPSFGTFQPPAAGGSYTDPVFGTAIKRLTNSMNMKRNDTGATLTYVAPEYSSMTPFNNDNSRLLLQ